MTLHDHARIKNTSIEGIIVAIDGDYAELLTKSCKEPLRYKLSELEPVKKNISRKARRG